MKNKKEEWEKFTFMTSDLKVLEITPTIKNINMGELKEMLEWCIVEVKSEG